jgi:hypothetical protein
MIFQSSGEGLMGHHTLTESLNPGSGLLIPRQTRAAETPQKELKGHHLGALRFVAEKL